MTQLVDPCFAVLHMTWNIYDWSHTMYVKKHFAWKSKWIVLESTCANNGLIFLASNCSQRQIVDLILIMFYVHCICQSLLISSGNPNIISSTTYLTQWLQSTSNLPSCIEEESKHLPTYVEGWRSTSSASDQLESCPPSGCTPDNHHHSHSDHNHMSHLFQHRNPFWEQGSKFLTFWISCQLSQFVTLSSFLGCLFSWLEISEKLVLDRGPDLFLA